MRRPKLREIGEALRSLFSRPYTTKFPAEPVIPPDGFRGRPQFYEEDCVGCLACAEVCPARAIDYVDDKDKKLRIITHRVEYCVFCGQCERACITEKGIKLTKEYILATFDRHQNISQSRKELVLCQNCGEVIAPLDQLKFLAKKLGPLLYTNPNLLLVRHAELKLLINQEIKSPHPRAGHLKLLCPNCRREMILKEQW
ncbi:MAG: 4Fe-4S binding protein, partial [Candidatus Margulisiibacteriota bacterium]